MAFKTTVVTGTYVNGDTDLTAGSIAKAINDVCAAATSVTSVSVMPMGVHGGANYMVAVIVWKNA